MRAQWLRRILPPASLFILLAVMAAYQDDLLRRFGAAAVSQVKIDLSYALQVSIWLSAAYLVNRLVQVFIWDDLVQRALGVRPPRLLRDVSTAVVFLIALSGMLNFVFGRSVTGIWATSGVAGLVLGFALRNIILDVFIGLAVNLEQPFRIGEFISVGPNLFGKVVEVNWRTTRLETDENNTVIVPNSSIGSMTITNYSRPDSKAEFDVVLKFDFSVNPERVLRVLTAGAMSVVGDGILEHPDPPKVRIRGVSADGIEYKVKYWIDCAKGGPGKQRHRILQGILDQLHQAGITPANGKTDVYYAPMPQRELDTRSLSDRMQLLSRVSLFSTLEESELEVLALDLVQKRVPTRSAVIKQGDPGESMFVVIEGLLQANIAFTPDADPTRVGQIRAGEFFGEMSLLTGEPRSATVVAATDVLLYELTKSNMDSIFMQRPELAEDISLLVARRRLANDAAYARATASEQATQETSLAREILAKIRSFFSGVFEPRPRGRATADTEVAAPIGAGRAG